MKNYKSTIICLLSAFAIGINANAADNKGTAKTQKNKKNKVTAVYKDANAPIEARVEDLLSRMTTEEKIMQLNQYTLGRNNNANNVGEEVKDIPAEIGSLIYFDTEPELRNIMQRQAMEVALGHPRALRPRRHSRIQDYFPDSVGTGLHMEPSGNRGRLCRGCTGSAYVGCRLDILANGRCGSRPTLGTRG